MNQVATRGWHNELPAWIKADPAYRKLRQGPRHTLQMIADRCDAPPRDDGGDLIGSEALLPCFGGEGLAKACGCNLRTLQRHVSKLTQLTLIVPLSRGGGRLANVYGVPGKRGELDPYVARPRERRGSGPGGKWEPKDSEKLRRQLRQDAAGAVTERRGIHGNTTQAPGQNAGLPSPKPSSSASAHEPPPDPAERHAIPHDDDMRVPRGTCRLSPASPEAMAVELSVELPDGAGPEHLTAFLRERGVDRGRAHKLAHNPWTTPAMVRAAIGKVIPRLPEIGTPGAYIAALLDDAISNAREAARQQREVARQATRQREQQMDALIGDMPDRELQTLIDRMDFLNGAKPETVRNDPVVRREFALRLAKIDCPRGLLESPPSC